MTFKTLFFAAFLVIVSIMASGQTGSQINVTDQQGRKQGKWIKKSPDGKTIYEGFFKDDHPVGEFRRFYEDKNLKSLFIFSDDGKEANATIYHPNGYVSSKGKYINQSKEGKWQFFSVSIDGYLISEENYSRNMRNGKSVKFFPDGTVAEIITYINDIREGEWIRYYPNSSICLKSNYVQGKINGKFEVWFENGKIQFSGLYKDDARQGLWKIYNIDGSLKYELEYVAGIPENSQMDIDESAYLDSLEMNPVIADPEKTGVMW
jgi:antitoxin component YwqK of YwqJK toxin-antitoxin module